MLKRTIFGTLAALFGITIISFAFTPALSIVLGVLAAVAAYEIEKAVKIQNKAIFVLSIIFAGLVPLYYEYSENIFNIIGFSIPKVAIVSIYIITLMILMLIGYERTKFEDVAAVIVASVMAPYAFASFITLRDLYLIYPERYCRNHGFFFILFALFCAWLSDTFAYFSGRFFGKHKLSPKISPKKTIEGAIGGVVGCCISCVVLFTIFDKYYFTIHSLGYLQVIILSIILSAISICGDLSASVVKRNFGVKDFGNVVPGHGGVMDRFDSGLFVVAVLNAIIMIARSVS